MEIIDHGAKMSNTLMKDLGMKLDEMITNWNSTTDESNQTGGCQITDNQEWYLTHLVLAIMAADGRVMDWQKWV